MVLSRFLPFAKSINALEEAISGTNRIFCRRLAEAYGASPEAAQDITVRAFQKWGNEKMADVTTQQICDFIEYQAREPHWY